MSAAKKTPTFYDARLIGASLKPVSDRLVQTEHKNIRCRWWHSSKDADLFIWQSDQNDRCIKMQFSFFGQIVEWNLVDGIRTGVVVEDLTMSQNLKGSELIQYDAVPNSTAIQLAIKVFHEIDSLDKGDLQELLERFSRPFTGQ